MSSDKHQFKLGTRICIQRVKLACSLPLKFTTCKKLCNRVKMLITNGIMQSVNVSKLIQLGNTISFEYEVANKHILSKRQNNQRCFHD